MNGKPQSATFEQPPPPPQLAPLAPVLVGGVDLVAQLSPEARRFLETSGVTVRPAMQLRPPLGSSRIESGPPAAEKTNQTILYVSIGAAALLGLLLLYRNL